MSLERSLAPRTQNDQLMYWLVVAAVMSTAFNDLWPVLPLGELSYDGFIYVLPVLAGYLLLFYFRNVALPVTAVVLYALMLGLVVASCALNWHEIATASFKGRSGIGRVITQAISLLFGAIILLLFFNVMRCGFRDALTRGAWLAIVMMAGFGAFEIAGWLGLPGLSQINTMLIALFHQSGDYVQRLRMTAFEVSWTSVVLTFLFPFAVARADVSARQVALMSGLVVIMVVLAQSRTALLVLFCQIAILGGVWLGRRFDILVGLAAARLPDGAGAGGHPGHGRQGGRAGTQCHRVWQFRRQHHEP